MTTTSAPHEPITESRVSTNSLAAMLIGAVVLELMILRIGTRTAVHIPGIEAVRGPYQVAAGVGRLSFAVAVVLLVVLLARLVRDLHRTRLDYLSASVCSFAIAALLRWADVIERGVLAALTATVVLVLALGVIGTRDGFIATPIGLFALAFSTAAASSVLHSETSFMSTGTLGSIALRSEELAIGAAILAGPLVRRGLGLRYMPSPRLAWLATGTAAFVMYAIRANASSTHILMLWNFGFTGTLPAAAYGLAAGSLVVSVVSALRHGHLAVAGALVLLPLGGIGLISTYQSGLTVAGLALAAAASDP